VAIELVFETHSTTVDNEQGRATGWLPGQLSGQGRLQARQLGRRRSGDQVTAVFSSDLARAAETASVAFAGTVIPVLHDWRLRECDYGQRNGMPVAELHAGRREHLDQRRVLVIGHIATRWGLDHFIGGVPLEDLIEQDFAWQEGWEYRIS
jgi:2,3-bisphosphoglycerate-dependent phosphoglycerate mutase